MVEPLEAPPPGAAAARASPRPSGRRWSIASSPPTIGAARSKPAAAQPSRSQGRSITRIPIRASSRARATGASPGRSVSPRTGRSGTAVASPPKPRSRRRRDRRPRAAGRARLADRTRVRQRALDLDSARASLVAAADGVRSAAEARRVVAERFNVGVATSTEVLDAQVALLQAELDRTRALASIRLAEARLDRALGR